MTEWPEWKQSIAAAGIAAVVFATATIADMNGDPSWFTAFVVAFWLGRQSKGNAS
jgi:hypothetical protein